MSVSWLIIADDLTGAADCAIAFAKAGLPTMVAWDKAAIGGAAAVVSLDTDSRRLSAQAAATVQRTALADCHRPGLRLYKKIDSTLRGEPAAELAAQLAWLAERCGRAPLAVVAPAFPGTGRTTENGRILVDGQPLEATPLWARDHTYASADLPAVLEGVGLKTALIELSVVRQGEAALRQALAAARDGAAAVVCDAASEDDLAAIAAASLAMAEDVLWVGSGGLAGHLARRIGGLGGGRPAFTGGGKPVLVAVGSLSESSRRQADRLVENGLVRPLLVTAEDLFAGPDGPQWRDLQAHLAAGLSEGRDMLVEIAAARDPDLSRGPELAALLARLIGPAVAEAGGLVMTGGDTARALLTHLGVHGIRLVDEVEAGVPLGITEGRARLPVVTKAGGFGDTETLARCIARLKAAPTA